MDPVFFRVDQIDGSTLLTPWCPEDKISHSPNTKSWSLEMMGFLKIVCNKNLLFQGCIFRCHVNSRVLSHLYDIHEVECHFFRHIQGISRW